MRVLAIAVLFAATPALLAGDPQKPLRYNGNGYAYFTGGACQHGYPLAGGGVGAEGFLWRGITLGGETSYQTFSDGLQFGLGQLQGGYHLVNRNGRAKWDPFVTTGIGLGYNFSGGVTGAANLGGGATYWFKDRLGLRMEFRVQGVSSEGIVTGRIGLSFR